MSGPEIWTGGAFGPEAGAIDVRYYEWERRQQGGEVQPSMVQGLPPSLAADLDGDGTPDAYWNQNLTLRRMGEAGRVDNPEWAASWNWGIPATQSIAQ